MNSPHPRQALTAGQRLTYGYFQFFDHFIGRERFFKMTRKQRTRFYRKLEQRLVATGEGNFIEVERRSDLSVAELKGHYMKHRIPVVLEGKAKDWACCKQWSLEYFKELHGEDEIIMMDQTDLVNGYEETTLGAVIDNIRSGGSKYYRFYPLLDRHPEHLADLDYNWLRSTRKRPCWGDAFHVFISGKEGFTPIHNANTPNMFVQAYGEKEWILYPVKSTAIVDPSPTRNMYRSAPIRKGKDFNAFHQNFEDYPLYQYIDGIKVHLKQGDVFFNPPFMWHTVKNPTDSIGIGYRTFTPFYSYASSPLYATLDLFATKPPIWKSYRLYADVNLIQLEEMGKLAEVEAKRQEKISSSVSS